MAQDGFGNYLVRVSDSVAGVTILMTPMDAREAVAHAAARYTILDPLVQPVAPLPIQSISPTGGKPTVTGSKSGSPAPALASLIAALVSLGLINDTTS